MKRVPLVRIVLLAALNILAMACLVHDFLRSDGFHYFFHRPERLLLVAMIAIAGGLLAHAFSMLPPILRRRLHLIALASAAAFVSLAGPYVTFKISALLGQLDPTSRYMPWSILINTAWITALFGLEFYHVLTTRTRVTPASASSASTSAASSPPDT